MNRSVVALSVICAFAFSGCVLVKEDRKGTGSSRSALSSSGKKDCHPSQYWDGEKCKHKGKGKGARKHDD